MRKTGAALSCKKDFGMEAPLSLLLVIAGLYQLTYGVFLSIIALIIMRTTMILSLILSLGQDARRLNIHDLSNIHICWPL